MTMKNPVTFLLVRKGTLHWFVKGDDHIWLSTANQSKRRAIAAWIDQAKDSKTLKSTTWPYWYRRGYRAVRAKINVRVIP
jgi:hypothetical protein